MTEIGKPKLSPRAQKQGLEPRIPMRKLRRSAHKHPKKPGNPNISRYRPAKSALFNGRLQKVLERAFIAFDGPITTTDALDWCYPLAQPPHRSRYTNVKRALRSIGAVKLRRLGGSA